MIRRLMRRPVVIVFVALGAVMLAVAWAAISRGTPSVRASFPGANGRIAFERQAGNWGIYTVFADGTGLVQLTSGPDNVPKWSPDGGRIVFEKYNGNVSDIWIVNSDGSGELNLTNNNPIDEEKPSWSPDGQKIAFDSNEQGSYQIYLMNPDGTGRTRLTNQPFESGGSAWSPDGSKIAFTSSSGGNFPEIWLMNADGSDPHRITDGAAFDAFPNWSPDGTHITFESHRDGNYEIYTMNTDGSGQTRLTTNSADDHRPQYSPDGTKIVFERSSAIFVMNADGSSESEVPVQSVNDSAPDWQPIPAPPTDTATATATATPTNTPTPTPIQTASATITATTGGTVAIAGNGPSVTIPANALAADTEIVLQVFAPSDEPPPPAGQHAVKAIELGPSGLTFSTPVTITVPYTANELGGANPSTLGIWLYTGTTWTFLGGVVDTIAMTISVQVEHFSKYAAMAPSAASVGGIAEEPDVGALTRSSESASDDHRTAFEFGIGATATLTTIAAGAWAMKRRRRVV